MNALSIDYGKKLLLIRKAEKLTQKAFSEITSLSLSTVKAYEIGQQTARAEVMEKVLKVNQFKKYTMWLLHDELLPEYGQISPNLLDVEAEKFKKVGRLSRKKEEVVNQTPSKKPNMQAIINSMSTLNDNELKQLAIILSRRGSLFLLELLDQKNRDLLDLTGIKKIAAWQLKDMDDERVREILSEMDKANLESKTVEEMNMSHKKRSVN